MPEPGDINNVQALAGLIDDERVGLLESWRQQVRQLPSARSLDLPALDDHMPVVLDEIVCALRNVREESIPEALAVGSPPVHGTERFQAGFDIVEVVAEYNILRGCLYDLAESRGLRVRRTAFHILNRVFDEAIGLAVQAYATESALAVQRRREEHLAFVAHDLRTPLSAIALASRVLEMRLRPRPTDAEVDLMLRTLQRNVEQLAVLVERVLKESDEVQTEGGFKLEVRTFDLWPLVESLIHDLHPVAGTATTQLVNEVPEELAVQADASLLRRILQNLIGNAIRHTPRGSVVIGARALPDRSIECWVSDNGTGIPADQLRGIFDRGGRDGGENGREGLGLAIVKTFVEAHGGRVTVESSEASGSVFRFTLPARPPASRVGRAGSER